MNPNAIHILEKNPDKVDWNYLSRNLNAIHILEKNLGRVDWKCLSKNPNAIHILEKNLGRVDWKCLSQNPSIFELDMNFIKSRMDIIREELIQKVLHPNRVMRFYLDYEYNILEDEMIEMDEDL
jgi:hypothetical protein